MERITLKAARVNSNYKVTEIAEKLGVSKSTVTRWENGKSSPRVEQMLKLCKLYNATINDIFLPTECTLSEFKTKG